MSQIASTPQPPYYAVIFSSHRHEGIEGYAETAARMVELAARQPGFLGVESVREDLGITVSYWSDLESIKQWKAQAEHREAQKMGMDKWYSTYKTRIALVERDYGR
ncbi:MAG: antibiotic biosynthesis monooxygenase [Gammaproteobacteria bacterium]|nr:antibiotic biosynthesis monooxygenase [Gammaproteobacteria bacterium]MCP4981889.1 antibiotic biosynthesis monooxygenase [Gammaproteobacteria bacterium]